MYGSFSGCVCAALRAGLPRAGEGLPLQLWWIIATDFTQNYRTIYKLYLDARTGVLLAAKRN